MWLIFAPKLLRSFTHPVHEFSLTKSNPMQENKTMFIWSVSRLKIVLLRSRRSYAETLGNF